jgi:hypothetical protein
VFTAQLVQILILITSNIVSLATSLVVAFFFIWHLPKLKVICKE